MKRYLKILILGAVVGVLLGVGVPLGARYYVQHKLTAMGYDSSIGPVSLTTHGVRFGNVKVMSHNVAADFEEMEVQLDLKKVILRRGEVRLTSPDQKAGTTTGSGWKIEVENASVKTGNALCESIEAKVLYKTEKSTMISHVTATCQKAKVDVMVAEKNETGWSVGSVSIVGDEFSGIPRANSLSPGEKKVPSRVSVQDMTVSYKGVVSRSQNVIYENRELHVGKSEISKPDGTASVSLEDSVISTLLPGEEEGFGHPKYKFRAARMRASVGTIGSIPVDVPGIEIDVYPSSHQYEAVVSGKLLWFGSWDEKKMQTGVNVFDRPCEAFKDLIPAGEDFKQLQVVGEIALQGEVMIGPSQRPNHVREAEVSIKTHDSCHFVKIPKVYNDVLEKPMFTMDRVSSKGEIKSALTGPGSGSWTKYEDISPHMTTAVLTTEDSSFFSHRGISVPNIEAALEEDLEIGKFRRGGSTITMQLAKNLWLQREKTLSRKMQEFFLTKLLEEKFPKKKILEYYFNVVEFGPDLYGIHDAAEQLFGVQPKDLTVEQSLALAMLLPNPKAKVVVDGHISDAYKGRVQTAIRFLRDGGKVSDAEYERAGAEIHRAGSGSWDTE